MNLLSRTERWLIRIAAVAFLISLGCALAAFGVGS